MKNVHKFTAAIMIAGVMTAGTASAMGLSEGTEALI